MGFFWMGDEGWGRDVSVEILGGHCYNGLFLGLFLNILGLFLRSRYIIGIFFGGMLTFNYFWGYA